MLTQKQLKSILHYNPKTGVFTRVKGNIPLTTKSTHSAGYLRVSIKYKRYYLHRLVFLYMEGYIPEEIDHINGLRADNRYANLRAANRYINNSNTKSKCGYVGVNYHKKSNLWRSRIFRNGREKVVWFKTKNEAVTHRMKEQLKMGEYPYPYAG